MMKQITNKLACTAQGLTFTSAFVFSTTLGSLLFCGQQHIANAATTTTTVEANIVSSINITAQDGIAFGDIGSSATPGSVSIDANGARNTTGGVTISSSTTGSPATFEVSGEPNSTYGITLPTSVIITSAASDTMTVNNFNSNAATNGQLDASGKQNLSVVATLNIGSFQAFGAYAGVMSATVEYN